MQEETKRKWFGAGMVIAVIVGALTLGVIAATVSEFNDRERVAREAAATQMPDVPKVPQESKEVVIIRHLAAGEPVSKSEFDWVFPTTDMSRRNIAIQRAAIDLGLEFEEVRYMVFFDNLAVTFTGDRTKIPEKLRSSAQPESTGPDLMILPVPQPLK